MDSRRPQLIVQAKLTPPVAPARLVGRKRITDLPGPDGQPRTVVVCAPAGFGKTTLVLQWLAQRGVQPAWYTLDRRDREPARFVAHLVASLQRVAPGLAQPLLDAVLRRDAGADEADIAALVHALQSVDRSIALEAGMHLVRDRDGPARRRRQSLVQQHAAVRVPDGLPAAQLPVSSEIGLTDG